MENMPLSGIWVYSRVVGIWLLVFEERSHSRWHLLPVVKCSFPLSCVKLIPQVVSSIGFNYFLFRSERRLWGAVLWHREALGWLEETSSLYRDLHGRKLSHWFRRYLVMLRSPTSYIMWQNENFWPPSMVLRFSRDYMIVYCCCPVNKINPWNVSFFFKVRAPFTHALLPLNFAAI